MPEIAECRRYVDQLNKEYGGHDLLNVEIVGGRFLKDKYLETNLSLLHFPMKNVTMNSKGKFIYWKMTETSTDQTIYFFITLGMAASFGKKNKHSAVKFTFDNDVVYYNDVRHFGTINVSFGEKELLKKLKSLGWDPLQNDSIPNELIPTLRSKKNYKTIAETLLDQKIFAGVGNYIRSEALYRAGIHPNKVIYKLTDAELTSLCNHIIDIVDEAYQCGGATIATYSDLYGNVGTFFNQFKVYGKKQDPLGNKVLTLTADDGRTVHYVKEIQPE